MVDKTVLHTLKSGLVLDRSIFASLPATDMAYVINNIRAAQGQPLFVVDGADTFFTPGVLVALISNKDNRYVLVNEALGGFFTEAQITALTNNNAVAGQVLDVIKPAAAKDPLIVNLGGEQAPVIYSFSPVPPGWSISSHMSLGHTKIKRKLKNAEGDGTMFAMTPEDYEKLWLLASKAWAGIPGAPVTAKFNTIMGVKLAAVADDRISLGGNYIRRYEIEQVAKYRNWAIPLAA